MRQLLITILLYQFILIPSAAQALADTSEADSAQTDKPWIQAVKERLDSLTKDPLLTRSQLGLMVYDLTADSAIYCYGEKQTLRPASTMKLITSITALDRLGADYMFRTSLYYKGNIENGVLTGDLYCVGGMDPLFDNYDMDNFVSSVKSLGVDTIRGRIVGDYTFKEENLLGEGWCWDDDNPNLTALLMNRNNDFLSMFKNRLMEDSIVVDAPCTSGPLESDSKLLCTRMHSLSKVLEPMLKESDNLYAESVFFQLAAASGVRPAKAVHARQEEKTLISKAGVSGVQYRIADGSGLSLYNYVTAELMTRVLRYAYSRPALFMRLYNYLPICGVDGTLHKRMTGAPIKGKIHAKTGTLSGISSLAGYCISPDKHALAFCIINQGVMRNQDGRDFQDKVCAALVGCPQSEIIAPAPRKARNRRR